MGEIEILTNRILIRINDVLEQQIKHTKGENFLEQYPPKEVGLRPHSMKAKTVILTNITLEPKSVNLRWLQAKMC